MFSPRGNFFRISADVLARQPKPLSLVRFSTNYTLHHRPVCIGEEKVSSFQATFVVVLEKNDSPPKITGFFMASGEKKVVFCWNPNSLSTHPPFLTIIYNDLLPTSPKLVFHSMCDVTFH